MREHPRRSFPTILTLLLLPLAASCEYRGGIGDDLAVRPLAPVNGAGAPMTVSTGGAQPVFAWTSTPAAGRFELQVDDSCTSAASCAFESPEIDEKSLTATSFTPTAQLPAGTSAPTTRRYYWRVRACQGDVCGAWSTVRIVVVGSHSRPLNADLNGDGFEDVVVGAPASSAGAPLGGAFFVYLGGAKPAATPAIAVQHDLESQYLGASVAMVGDYNGDGFGDYIVRTLGSNLSQGITRAASAYLYFGGPQLSPETILVLDCPSIYAGTSPTAGIGDVNGDGFDDFAFGGARFDADLRTEQTSRVEVHFGGTGVLNAPDLTLRGDPPGDPFGKIPDLFGSSIAGVGDVNGDGFDDFAVGAPGSGKVRIYFGGPDLDETADVTLVSPRNVAYAIFGVSVAGIGDFNGDGFADLAVGEPSGDAFPGPLGAVYVYFGGALLSDTPSVTFVGSTARDAFGMNVVGAGDVDGDGFDDLAILTPGVAGPTTQIIPAPPGSGLRVDLFRGGATPDPTAAFLSYDGGPASAYQRGLAARDLDGDARPDLLVGRWTKAPSSTSADGEGRVDVLLGATGYTARALSFAGLTATDEFGASIAR